MCVSIILGCLHIYCFVVCARARFYYLYVILVFLFFFFWFLCGFLEWWHTDREFIEIKFPWLSIKYVDITFWHNESFYFVVVLPVEFHCFYGSFTSLHWSESLCALTSCVCVLFFYLSWMAELMKWRLIGPFSFSYSLPTLLWYVSFLMFSFLDLLLFFFFIIIIILLVQTTWFFKRSQFSSKGRTLHDSKITKFIWCLFFSSTFRFTK